MSETSKRNSKTKVYCLTTFNTSLSGTLDFAQTEVKLTTGPVLRDANGMFAFLAVGASSKKLFPLKSTTIKEYSNVEPLVGLGFGYNQHEKGFHFKGSVDARFNLNDKINYSRPVDDIISSAYNGGTAEALAGIRFTHYSSSRCQLSSNRSATELNAFTRREKSFDKPEFDKTILATQLKITKNNTNVYLNVGGQKLNTPNAKFKTHCELGIIANF